ncbi:MAG: transporter [Leptospiraceae bacterium]|nr:MAG: transporter [Leptospiraceae bacterium]
MANILLIIICFLSGIIFKRYSEATTSQIKFPKETPQVLNSFIIYISLPALILYHIHELKFQKSLIALIFMPWIIFIIAILLFTLIGKIFFNWEKEKNAIGALILCSGLGNTSFVGLPMIEAYYGKEYLSYGLLADQAGTFFMLSTLGIIIAARFSEDNSQNQNISIINSIKRILLFPPFFVLIITLILKTIQFDYPDWLKQILLILGNTLTPLALFSVGFQLKLNEIKNNGKYLTIGLFYKLLLAPILIAFLYSFWEIDRNVYYISIFEAAMGPMITGGIVAISYNLRPSLVSLMLAIGISLSFLTLPIFWYFFH